MNIDEPDKVERDMSQWGGADDIDLIVVSDGEQILGIGDQGVGGILISVAKLGKRSAIAKANECETDIRCSNLHALCWHSST